MCPLVSAGLSGATHTEVERALLSGQHLEDVIDGHVDMNKLVFNNSDVQYQLHQASRVFIDRNVHLSKKYKDAT